MSFLFGHLVRIFESDSRWLWRVLAAGGCGLIIAIGSIWQLGAKVELAEAVVVIVALPMLFLAAGCLLATMDNVQRQMQSNQTISRLSRILFGMRAWSLLLWSALVIIGGVASIMSLVLLVGQH